MKLNPLKNNEGENSPSIVAGGEDKLNPLRNNVASNPPPNPCSIAVLEEEATSIFIAKIGRAHV